MILLIITVSCVPPTKKVDTLKAKNSFYKIDVANLMNKQREVYLSEIADSIEYVPLETSKISLLDFIFDAQFTKDFIFIHQAKGPLAQFDRSGKFIRYISRIGRGPEEYGLIREFSVDEVNRNIFIHSNYTRTINIYSFEGEFLRTVRYPDDYGNIVWSRDSLFMCFSEPKMGKEETVFDERNSKGEIIQSIKNHFFWQNNSNYSFMSGFNVRNVFYRLHNTLNFKGWYNDTVYTFSDDNKFIPKFLLELRNNKLPDQLRPEVTQKPVSSPEFYWASVKESSRFAFIIYGTYADKNLRIIDIGLICYDKLNATGFSVLNKNEKSEFINDLDNGPDFEPEYINDSLAFCFISASRFLRFLKTDSPHVNNDKKEILINKFKKLEESDNPILMKVRLKL